MSNPTRYPAKLLLFGEYVLLLGAPALAVPVPVFGGQWSSEASEGDTRREQLSAFAESAALAAIPDLDLEAFRRDIAAGWHFRSDIPEGYGLGSSGALCAGVYDRYARRKTADLAELKALFAQMESHFHGKSSGIDPLTSYLNQPLLLTDNRDVHVFESRPWQGAAPVVFLLDSGSPRRTGPLVQWFLGQTRNPAFAESLEHDYLPANAALLEAWQNGQPDAFWKALVQVSDFQLTNMPPMIPEHLRGLWRDCRTEGDPVFKICGAGGGGFVLGFCKDPQIARQKLSDFTLVFPFQQHGLVEN